MEAVALQDNVWWGDFRIGIGESLLWELGAVRFAVQRQELEWRIACTKRPEEEQDEWQITRPEEISPDINDAWERYVCAHNDKPLHIMPVLADRSVVSRPSSPFTLLPGEAVQIYVSTPLWVKIMMADKEIVLKEFSLLPLSDTWFGSSTREGELCYAARTYARLVLDAMPHHAHRATTVLILQNRAESVLVLERLNLPVTYLGLYHNGAGELWTEAIELIRGEDSDTAELKIKPGPPIGVKGAERIAEPRKRAQDGLLVRTLGSLFG